MDMNYYDSFIAVADDCPVTESVVPIAGGDRKTGHPSGSSASSSSLVTVRQLRAVTSTPRRRSVISLANSERPTPCGCHA